MARNDRLNQLSLEVFREFARCEYALKAAGFRSGGNNVSADWRAFADTVDPQLAHPRDPDVAAAIDYLLRHPPKKQVLRGGQLAWDDTPPQSASHADLVLAYVRRVRNNLFHGGKFNGHWFEPQRSTELLAHSLCILRYVVQANERVREAYKRPITDRRRPGSHFFLRCLLDRRGTSQGIITTLCKPL